MIDTKAADPAAVPEPRADSRPGIGPGPPGPPTRTIVALAWPIAMNAILLQSITIIDTLLVAPLGESALAAMGLATGLIGIVIGTLFAFSSGTQLIAAQAVGADNQRALATTYRAGLIVNVAIAAAGALIVLLAGDALLARLSPTPAVAQTAAPYLRWFVVVFAGVALCQHITVMLYATGRSRPPLFANLIELPVNAALSYLLVFGAGPVPAFGLTGAAIGSALAVGLRALLLLRVRKRFSLAYRVQPTLHKPKNATSPAQPDTPLHEPLHALTEPVSLLRDVRAHVRHALPIAGSFISATLATNVCVIAYARLGVSQFAALTLIMPWIKVGSQLVSAWAQATSIQVGQLLGRGSVDLLDEFVGRAWRIALGIATVVMIAYLGLAFSFQSLYGNLDQQTIDSLHSLAPLLLALPWMRTSNTICGNVLRAGGLAGWSFKVHAGTQWLFTVPVTLLFVLVLDLSVAWVFSVIVMDEFVKAIPFHRGMASGRWKQRLVGD